MQIVETASRLYLVMEFASGGELFDFIVQRQRVDEPTARRLFRQILSGVEALHDMCICHRSIHTPTNQHTPITTAEVAAAAGVAVAAATAAAATGACACI